MLWEKPLEVLIHTFPVFINYNKDESINDSIKYEDRFLISLSKQSRTAESKDIQHIYNMKEDGTKMNAVGEPKEIVMKNVDNSAVEITYQLETAVREDLFEYLVE